jgi:DNA-binding response OmpR family regulator
MNILLVEDDAGIVRFVSRGLSNHGYQVDHVREGAAVPAMVRSGRYDAVLLDLGLPDMDGLTLADILKREAEDVAIVILTARGALQDRLDGFARGADDYLAKPFAFEELLARLSAVLRRRGRVDHPRCGALVFEHTAGRFRLEDELLQLTRREFELLAMLMRRPGATLSREELIAGAWPDAPDISDNALNVYIGYLRRKLALHANGPVIETVRNQGFRLVKPESATNSES